MLALFSFEPPVGQGNGAWERFYEGLRGRCQCSFLNTIDKYFAYLFLCKYFRKEDEMPVLA